MSLSDYQYSYRDLTMGAGTNIKVVNVDGLDDLDVRAGDMPMPRGVGDVPGLHVAAGREVILDLIITGDRDSQSLADLRKQALAAFTPAVSAVRPFSFKEPGFDEQFVYARTIGRVSPRVPERSPAYGYIPMKVRLKLADPRIYGATLRSSVVPIYEAGGGGLDFDIDYAKEFAGGGGGSGSERNLNNAGNSNAYPYLRFYGPETGATLNAVKVVNVTTGQEAQFTGDILSGQVLNADMRRVVTADPGDTPWVEIGGVNRYGTWDLPRDPFRLQPGDNLIRFITTGTSSESYLVAFWRDTSI